MAGEREPPRHPGPEAGENSPDVRSLVDEAAGEEVDEGAHFRLGESARRIDGVNALNLDRQAGDGLFDKALRIASE